MGLFLDAIASVFRWTVGGIPLPSRRTIELSTGLSAVDDPVKKRTVITATSSGSSVSLSSATPQPLGTAAAGSATTAARGDHVHASPLMTATFGLPVGMSTTSGATVRMVRGPATILDFGVNSAAGSLATDSTRQTAKLLIRDVTTALTSSWPTATAIHDADVEDWPAREDVVVGGPWTLAANEAAFIAIAVGGGGTAAAPGFTSWLTYKR